MIIVDPVELGDAACTRPSPKLVWSRTGTLVEVPINTVGVTYDPVDLSRAPYALIEPESTNLIRNSTMQGAVIGSVGAPPTNWTVTSSAGGLTREIANIGVDGELNYIDIRYSGIATSSGSIQISFDTPTAAPAVAGQVFALSIFQRLISGVLPEARLLFLEQDAGGAQIGFGPLAIPVAEFSPLAAQRVGGLYTVQAAGAAYIRGRLEILVPSGTVVAFTLRIGLPQLERDQMTSPINTSGTGVTRAADVLGATAGLIYSNVPMVEPPYNSATTYAKDAAVYDPVSKIVYWSMQAANLGKPLSDPAWWNKRTAINRWAMFDDRNSTVTSNPEEIIAVVSARAITQGAFAGALDASEVLVSMTHPTRGLVYSEARNLVLPRSGSSFFGWCFNRLRMRTWFLTLKLPVFANALVTITIRKPGGVAKCGMCLQGPVVDSGRSMIGLSSELKDYSSTTFYTDGTSDTIVRGYSKRMSVDVMVETDRVEELEDYLSSRRQKTLVYLASTTRGDTMLVGKFASLRKVIGNFHRSTMSLQIEGVLNR